MSQNNSLTGINLRRINFFKAKFNS